MSVRLRRAIATCGVAVVGITATVIVGWVSRATLLIEVGPAFRPMYLNTALCLALVGAGLALSALAKRRVALILGCLAAILGSLMTLQHVLGAEFGLDQLLLQDYVTPVARRPGRMTLLSAVCIAVGGVGVAVGNRFTSWRHAALLVAVTGSLTAGLGIAAVSRHSLGTSEVHDGHGLSAVALHTAVVVFVMGAGLVALAWSRSDLSRGELAPGWLPVPVGLVAVGFVVALLRVLIAQEDMALHRAVNGASQEVQERLEDHASLYARAVRRIAERQKAQPKLQADVWRSDAGIYTRDFLGLWAILRTHPNGRIQAAAPLEDNGFLLETDLSAVPSIVSALNDSRRHSAPRFSAPFDLPPRGVSLAICAPIVRDREASGFVVALIDPASFLTLVGDEYIERNYGVEIRSNGHVLHASGAAPARVGGRWKTVAAVDSLGQRFQITVRPNATAVGEAISAIPLIVFVIGMSAAAGVTVVTRLGVISYRNASELASTNESLQGQIGARREAETAARQNEERVRQLNHQLADMVRERTADLRAELDGRKRVEVALRESEQERSQLIVELMTAQESERARIARDLHDHAGQALSSLLVGLKALSGMDGVAEVRRHAGELRELAAQTLDQVRTLSFDMYPSVLEHLGLVAALEQDAVRFSRLHDIAVDIHAEGEPGDCPHRVKSAIYQVVHAALTNIAQHARARNVGIVVRPREGRLTAIVEDDGVGFDVDAVLRGPVEGRFGLLAMQERLRPTSGTVQIESTPGEGTSLFIEVEM